MRLNDITEVKKFEKAIEQTKGSVWLEIKQAGKEEPILNVDMKSSLSRYVALGKIIDETHNEGNQIYFELFCQFPEDEPLFFDFFEKYPDTLKEKSN